MTNTKSQTELSNLDQPTKHRKLKILRSRLAKLMRKEGYVVADLNYPCPMKQNSDTCIRDGRKNNFEVYLSLNFADNFHHKIPAKDVSPKIWRALSVDILRD